MAKIVQNDSLGKISIDSLKVRIPITKVKILDDSLTSRWMLINEGSGEVDEDYYKENTLKKNDGGINVRFGIEEQVTASRTKETYLTMLLPSKVLKSRYFEGITIDNINIVYDYIMSLEVVYFTQEAFLKHSACTDVDFKKDTLNTNLGASLNIVANNTKPSKKKNEGYRLFNQKDNIGIEFSDRRTKSYKSNPYLKIYHKALELNTKSKIFAREHLQGVNYDDVVRIETTVKNKAHFRYLGIMDTTLDYVLKLTEEQKNGIIGQSVAKHLEPRVREIKTPSEITPNDMILHKLIVTLMDKGMSYDTIKHIATSDIKNKSTRSRKKSELDKIYYDHIKGSDTDKKTLQMDEFFNFIGWS